MGASSDEMAVRELVEQWAEATARGDIATIADLMSPDVVFLGPGRPPIVGREAFASAAAEMASAGLRINSGNDIREVVVSGDLAYCWSDLEVAVTMPTGEVVRRVGPVLSVLRRHTDGRWRIERDANMLTMVEATNPNISRIPS